MFSHVTLGTNDIEKAEQFHDAVMTVLGHPLLFKGNDVDAALANGGTDEGPPGLRAYYHPNYYGAYVRDPDGNKIQAV